MRKPSRILETMYAANSLSKKEPSTSSQVRQRSGVVIHVNSGGRTVELRWEHRERARSLEVRGWRGSPAWLWEVSIPLAVYTCKGIGRGGGVKALGGAGLLRRIDFHTRRWRGEILWPCMLASLCHHIGAACARLVHRPFQCGPAQLKRLRNESTLASLKLTIRTAIAYIQDSSQMIYRAIGGG